ncbi:PhoU domain-containing protein, partial [Faecalimonas sp.]
KIISNIERVGDHAMNFLGYAKDLKQWGMKFSDSALKEVEEMKTLCAKALEDITVEDLSKAEKILEKSAKNEQKIDDMKEMYLKKQIERMKKGACKAETGIIFSEILTDFERIGDHILNIGEQYNEMM